MRPGCLKTIHDLMLRDDRVVFIGSDIGVGLLDQFSDLPPGRAWMEGIAEQNLIGVAAGLARSGKVVYVAAIASFLTRRAYEQIALDIALPGLPVRLVGLGGGIMYASEGPTHTATDDIALMRQLGVTVLAPADARECNVLVAQGKNYPGPLYIRLGWGNPVVADWDVAIGDALYMGSVLSDTKACVVTTGNMLGTCEDAIDILRRRGIYATVMHFPTIGGDANLIGVHAPIIITVEEGIISGLGNWIAESYPVARRFGLPIFPEGNGTRLDMLARYGLTAENIAAKVEEIVNG